MSKNLYRRNGVIWARFKVRGVEYRESLRTRSEAIAERRLKARREAIQNQVIYGESAPRAWPEAVIGWLPWIKRTGARPGTIRRYGTSIATLRPWLDPIDVQEIDAQLIKKIIRERAKQGVTNATIRRDLTALSSVLDYALSEGWIEANAAYAHDRRALKESRDPIVLPTLGSIARVLAMGTRWSDMAAFAIETGMRQEEIASLTHGQIDRRRLSASLTHTKGRRPREVPLTPHALQIIDRQPPFLRQPWVFWRADGQRFLGVATQWGATMRRIAGAAQKAAQGEPFVRFRFHDLRHLFAVDFLRHERGSIYDLQAILGHSSIKVTERYLAYLTPDEKRAAMQGVAQKAARILRSADDK